MTEQWRPVTRFPQFMVSDLGRVRNRNGSIKRTPVGNHGYPVAGLWDGQRTHAIPVHQLVCEAFHGPRPSPAHQVAHGDGDRTNNQAFNLRWATAAENAADTTMHGRHSKGEDCSYAKLTARNVAEIRAAPKRSGECARLAAKFGVTKNHIAKIRTPSRGIWPMVPFPTNKERDDA